MNNPYHQHQAPITDIKNHPMTGNRDTKKSFPLTTNTSTNETSSKIRKLQKQIEQLRSALCQALDDNDCLRLRVAELEALLVEAQDENEKIRERYICDEKRLVRYWKTGQKEEMQMERHNQSALESSFYRSRSM